MGGVIGEGGWEGGREGGREEGWVGVGIDSGGLGEIQDGKMREGEGGVRGFIGVNGNGTRGTYGLRKA